ncbi:hypothetical protein ACM66B_003046 [Microbotryomycetes sp. NB124-2]
MPTAPVDIQPSPGMRDSHPGQPRQHPGFRSESSSGSLGAAEDELARRCRMLARSVGHEAVYEQQLHYGGDYSPRSAQLSPAGTPSPATPSRSPRLAAAGLSPLSPTHKHHALPPPSPRSASAYLPPDTLAGISEEESSTTSTAAQASGSHPTWHSSQLDNNNDDSDDVSDIDSYMTGRRRLSSHTTLGSLKLLHNDGQSLYVNHALLKSSLQDGVSHFVIDVWLVDGELLVGHDKDNLSSERTLSSMYLEPLQGLLSQSSPRSSFSFTPHHRRRSSTALASLATKYMTRPLLLLLNLRTDPVTTFQFLLHYLLPLVDASLLTTYYANSAQTEQGLVTVACTDGQDALKAEVASLAPRYVFLAAMLDEEDRNWNKEVCTFVTAEMSEVLGATTEDLASKGLSSEQASKITSLVERVHGRGAKLRIGGTEGNESLSQHLVQLGVDYC